MKYTSDQSLNSAFETFVRLVMSDGPIDQLDDLATIDAMGYGTAIDEVIHNLTELKNLARLQREQTADTNLQYDSTPVFRKLMNHGKTSVFVDEIKLNFVFDCNPMSFQIRLSVIMELIDGKWKAVHFHASKPEYDSGGSDPWHKEEWKKKNEELQRLVDEKTADLAGKNRELEIEAALERVRTVATIMQKPNDLLDVCRIISEQLELLNVINIRNVQVAIIDESKKTYSNYQFFTAYSKAIFEETLYEKNPASRSMVAEMQKSANSFFIGSIKDDELQKFRDWRKKYDQYPDPLLDNLTEVFYYFYSIGEGGLGLTTYKAIDDKELDIFKRFHLVFKLAYRRFMDIQQAEAQALRAEEDLIAIKVARKNAEEALSELKATQAQLIHAEKMASLGELTAGIAHEIQNPLNFVNNFSEVSIELIDELKQESSVISHQSSVVSQQSAIEIMDDIRQNLYKILHHGKRADAIVKGMLQHSRSSTGAKEPTDINALADEYLRLAYHGLRANDKDFNATMKTDFDENIGNVNIIPQDIGRVILNLITNAFYAVYEKKKQLFIDLSGLKTLTGQKDYEPTVIVSTKKTGNNVLISVKDNGLGIPENIKNKIFQPFFTTKPTGQGTGLGLSLSYDIVKAHGGDIKVNTKENEGTEFKISLPYMQ